MKKIVGMLMAVMLVALAMVGCGKSGDASSVDSKLNNTIWVSSGQDYATGQNFTTTWNFADGKVSAKNTLGAEEFPVDNGTYKVNANGIITLNWEQENNNRIIEIHYVLENDELKLYMDKQKEAELKRQ